jgi:uncharacterized protein (TIGR02271 family)
MIDQQHLSQIAGSTVYGPDGGKIGKAGQIYLDDQTGEPTWVTVNTGLFGTNESLVPLQNASLVDEGLRVAYEKDVVKDAPNIEADGSISPDEEANLYAYYNLGNGGAAVSSAQGDGTATGDQASDEAMTRSEERVDVSTETVESGRARLRKYVVTENVTQTVPVRREEAVIEREPITDANEADALSGPDISEGEHEVILHEERPVVEKTVEPVERVRLTTETVADEESVSEDVRKEQIDVDGDIRSDSDSRS